MEELRHFVGGRDFWNQQQLDTLGRKMKSKIAARRRRQDPERREREREKNLVAMRRRREDPETRERERERNRIAMRLKRQDPEFREKEKQAMKMRRLTDPEMREKDKIAHRIRRQNHDAHEIERQRRKHLAMHHLAQHLKLAESVGSASFFLSEVTRSDLWRSPLAMEQTRLPRCTNEVEIIPFNNVTIKQEQDQEVEMDPSLTATMMNVVLKDDSNASSGDVEELVVEPSLLEFKCFHDDNDDDDNDRQEEDHLHPPTLVFMPETDHSECYSDEYGNYENAASESKRLKYALKKFIQTQRSQRSRMPPQPLRSPTRSGAGGRHAGAPLSRDAIFRCPHCYLCLTSSDYLNRHVRRGCRFRDAPIKNAYRCTQCGAGFSNYGELFQHRRRAHSDPQCPFKTNAPSKPRLPPVGFPDLPRCVLPSGHHRPPPSSDIVSALSSGLSLSRAPVAAAATSSSEGPASQTPDLVVSSSSAVNHFEPVVPDVAANSDPPASRCLAPDIVSCSRPAAVVESVASAARGSGPPTSDSTPPDVVASAPRDATEPQPVSTLLQPGGGSLVRLNCNALKRRNPEASARSAEGTQK